MSSQSSSSASAMPRVTIADLIARMNETGDRNVEVPSYLLNQLKALDTQRQAKATLCGLVIISDHGRFCALQGYYTEKDIFLSVTALQNEGVRNSVPHLAKFQHKAIKIPEFALDTSVHRLPTRVVIEEMMEIIVKQPTLLIHDTSMASILAVLTMVYPSVLSNYDEYWMLNPDNVAFFENMPESLGNKLEVLDGKPPVLKQTICELTALLIIVFVHKNTNDNEVHASEVIKNRMNAYLAAVSKNSVYKQDDLFKIANVKFFMGLHSRAQQYPRLREFLMMGIITHCESMKATPLQSQTVLLCEETYMTPFMMIKKFISSRPTLAHVHPVILPQIVDFFAAFKKLEDRWGHLWKMAKVLDSNTQITNQAQWPELATCAFLWYKSTNPSMANYRMSSLSCSVSPVELLSTFLAPEVLTSAQVKYTNEHYAVCQAMGIDLKALMKVQLADVVVKEVGIENRLRTLQKEMEDRTKPPA